MNTNPFIMVLRFFLVILFIIHSLSSSSWSASLPKRVVKSTLDHRDHTAISDFRVLNRRYLLNCPNPNPYIQINISPNTSTQLSDDGYITVNVTGILLPSSSYWVAMISPSHSNVTTCIANAIKYEQTGDLSSLPLLCHYPVKAQYLSTDREFLSCKRKECKESVAGICAVTTCGATLSFHIVNIRTDIEFVLFAGGFETPCILKRSEAVSFANPNKPLYGHISSIDSTATSGISIGEAFAIIFKVNHLLHLHGYFSFPATMATIKPPPGGYSFVLTSSTKLIDYFAVSEEVKMKSWKMVKLTWVSGDQHEHEVQYGDGNTAKSSVSTFSQKDMCTSILESPAVDFGWHDPGYIHSAVMRGLNPSTTYSYKYGRCDSAGWSDQITFKTPPAGGSDEVKFLAYGDMGKAPLDSSVEHYIQPGSVSVIKAMAEEVSSGSVDSIFHIGDISYATGFLVEWDFFLHLITPLASQVSYMTAIGNHERDYIGSGSIYITPDSGGECGVPYEAYFPMPTQAKDKPWYSIEQGSVHFTVISTEHNWSVNSEQYNWMNADMASVNRTRTPWLIFTGHRPMYSSSGGIVILPSVDNEFVKSVEPLLLTNKVDLALYGHVHNYERTCAVYQQECKAMPVKDSNGMDTYDNTNYTAPVHAVIGMAGFKLDSFSTNDNRWSLVRISEFGYLRLHAKKEELKVEFVNAGSRNVDDRFRITKS